MALWSQLFRAAMSLSESTTIMCLNNARVVTPNVLIAGGVVHVIDNVLNPANATAQDDGDDEEGSGAFDGATPGDEAPFTSGVPEPTTTIGDATPTGSPC